MDLVEVKGISKRRKRPRILQVKDAWQNTRRIGAALPNHRADCAVLRFADQRNPRLRWTDFDFKRSAVLIQRSAVGKRLNKLKTECSQDEVSARTGLHRRTEEMARAVSRVRGAMALSQSGDRSTLTRRLDSCRLFGSDRSAIGTWKDRVPHVPPHLSCVAGRNRSTRGRAAEAHATRAHFHHDGPVWQCVDGSQTQSQSASRATTLEKKPGREQAFIQ